MVNKIYSYIRITPRSLAVTLIILVLLDLITRFYFAGLYQNPGSIRLVNDQVESLRRLEHEVRSAKGYKIIFLGDSQVYGSSVKSASETVPAYLEQELRRIMPEKDVKIFNFAFKGMGISENYFVLNTLIDEDIDLIVYNLSTSWFNRKKMFDHPNVINLTDILPSEEKLAKMGITTNESSEDRFSEEISFAIGRVWNLYGRRAELATWILGKSVREKITDLQLKATDRQKALQKEQQEQRLYQSWYAKDWKKILKVNYKFGQINLNPYNPQVVFYKMILESINRRKLKSLIYESPQNIAMLEKFYDMDEDQWNKNLVQIKNMSKSPYVIHQDYTHLVPDKYFTDAIHMDKHGNRLVAQELAQVIATNWRE